MMDAFTTALMLPNMFRRLFAEGAFAQAFVPVYGGVRAREGEEAAANTIRFNDLVLGFLRSA